LSLKRLCYSGLNYSTDSKQSLLSSIGYITDVGKPELCDSTENGGLANRATYTENGQKWDLYGKLSHDLGNQAQAMPPNTKIKIRLHRNTDEFILMVDQSLSPADVIRKGYKLVIENVYLDALRLKLSPSTVSYLENALATKHARYYLDRTEIR
jgi:hypothetical protein